MNRFTILTSAIILCLLFFSLTSCNSYEVPHTKLKEDSVKKEDITIIKRDTSQNEICQTQNVKWAPGSSESILLNPQPGVIYPGSLLDAVSFQNGKFTPITGKRKPFKLSISGPIFETSSVLVSYPSPSSVDSMVNIMLKSKKLSTEPSQTSINCYEIYSKEQLNLLFRSKYSGGITNIEAGFNFNDENIKSRYLLDVTQVYYSINVDPISPKDFFSSKPDSIGNFSPVYVSSIKYGRRILIAMETQKNIQNRSADLKAQFSSFAGTNSVNTDLFSEKLFSDKSIKLLVMGGNPNNAFNLFRAVSAKDTLFNILIKDATWSLSSTGFPLAYTVRNAYDNSVFMVAQYGEYVARKCVIKPTVEKIIQPKDINQLCAYPNGGDREFNGDPNVNFSLKLSFEGHNIFAQIKCDWKERGGDNSSATYFGKHLVASIGQDSTILSIESAKELSGLPFDSKTKGYHPTAFDFQPETSPIRSVSILGDTPDDDDPWVGPCGTEHSQVTSIKFYPIKITAVKTK